MTRLHSRNAPYLSAIVMVEDYLDKGATSIFLPKVVRAVDAAEAWVPGRIISEILDRLLRLAVRKRRAQGVQ
ncbi:MAG: hypothetical protein ACE5MK_10355, partial [Acidobacteriota bacterium]